MRTPLCTLLMASALLAQETPWTVSTAIAGQASDTSQTHQATLTGSWKGTWSIVTLVPSLQVAQSLQTRPESTWTEVQPSLKVRLALGPWTRLTTTAWSTTIQSPWDAGGSSRLTVSPPIGDGTTLSGWTEVDASKLGLWSGGAGASLGRDWTEDWYTSVSGGVWESRQTLPTGKTMGNYTPQWNLGADAAWNGGVWSLGLSTEWTWWTLQTAAKQTILKKRTVDQSLRHDDWTVSLDASWEPSEAWEFWSDLGWEWTSEDGSVQVTRNANGKSTTLAPNALATRQSGPSWEVGSSFSW